MRELLLWVAITSATLTSIFVTSHHYSTQGCRASRRAARRTGTKQYSNELFLMLSSVRKGYMQNVIFSGRG